MNSCSSYPSLSYPGSVIRDRYIRGQRGAVRRDSLRWPIFPGRSACSVRCKTDESGCGCPMGVRPRNAGRKPSAAICFASYFYYGAVLQKVNSNGTSCSCKVVFVAWLAAMNRMLMAYLLAPTSGMQARWWARLTRSICATRPPCIC